ncbi:dipeptide/oligopeptide/nickel ABC transporter ATP-binding protein [Clostridia bacterium]|nr:dipeptide/oligopeptide/nickel ABC transporter ATP-binding protein [Clostridia bacterium]
MFAGGGGKLLRAVENADLSIEAGESVALVGESGCGKSVTGFSIMRLLKTPPAIVRADRLTFDGADILTLPEPDMQAIRGRDIGMIFQEPSSALNPVMTVGKQVDEVFLRHRGLKQKEAREATVALFRDIGISAPERRYHQYPHELSGGMKQRILIATATACRPKLLIADEPTTALDVTIQAQILELLRELREKNKMSMLLITHDLGVVAHNAERVHVMYCGKIVETGRTAEVLTDPLHPYTKGLLRAVPRLGEKRDRFEQIPLSVPHPSAKPEGCYFHPRCSEACEACKKHMPPLMPVGKDGARAVRCWRSG